MNIGKAIKDIRKAKGITQKELASLIDRSVNAVCDIEKGKSWPSMETVNRFAKALGVPQSYILLFSITEEDVPEDKRQIFKVLAEPLKKGLLND